MSNQDNGWDKIAEQNDKSVKKNNRKENMNIGYNVSMGVITIITIILLAFIYACAKWLGM